MYKLRKKNKVIQMLNEKEEEKKNRKSKNKNKSDYLQDSSTSTSRNFFVFYNYLSWLICVSRGKFLIYFHKKYFRKCD